MQNETRVARQPGHDLAMLGGGGDFAIDAGLIQADVSKQRFIPGEQWYPADLSVDALLISIAERASFYPLQFIVPYAFPLLQCANLHTNTRRG